MKKKTLSLALFLALCLSLTVPVLAEEYGPLEIPFQTASSGTVYFVLDQAKCSGDAITVKPETTFSAKSEGEEDFVFLYPYYQDKSGQWQVIWNFDEFVSGKGVTKNAGELFSRANRRVETQAPEEAGAAIRFDVHARDCNTKYYIYLDNSTDPQPTTPPAGTKTASPTNDKLEVNGAAANPTVYKIGGSNYFKIRDVAALLSGTEKQFAVGYSGGRVTVTSGQPYEATGKELAGPPAAARDASPSNDSVLVDGAETSLTVYKIGGSNYFKLRDLGKVLDFYVGWEAGRGMYIETDKPYNP